MQEGETKSLEIMHLEPSREYSRRAFEFLARSTVCDIKFYLCEVK